MAEQQETDEILQHKKRAFLAAYAECGNITKAAEAAQIARQTHYDWMHNDSDYPSLFADAEEAAADKLEQEARRRAIHGVDEPVYYKGEEVGTVRKYSDTLLIFLLNGAKPEKYKQRVQSDITGKLALDVDIERMEDSEILSGIAATLQAINDLKARIGTEGE